MEARVNLLKRGDLRRGQALIGFLSGLALNRSRIEMALARIVENAVGAHRRACRRPQSQQLAMVGIFACGMKLAGVAVRACVSTTDVESRPVQ